MQKVKPTVLILCTGNSCRSHLAEGILRDVAGDFLNVQSAGSKPAGYVHPLGIQVMKEIGIDISSHHSKHMMISSTNRWRRSSRSVATLTKRVRPIPAN